MSVKRYFPTPLPKPISTILVIITLLIGIWLGILLTIMVIQDHCNPPLELVSIANTHSLLSSR